MDSLYATPKSNIAGPSQSQGGVTPVMLDHLRRTKPWVMLVSIMLIVFSLLAILGVVGVFVASKMPFAPSWPFLVGAGAIYLVSAVFFCALGVFLFKYSGGIKRLLMSKQSTDLEAALASQRVFWVLFGIFALIVLLIIIVVLVIRVVSAL